MMSFLVHLALSRSLVATMNPHAISNRCIVMMAGKSRKGSATSKPASKGGFGGFGAKPPKRAVIPSLQLNTGAEVPALCFGTYRCNGEPLGKALEHAIATGYRHFDTAHGYQNEAVVGAAIARSGVPREDFFITTKLWCADHGEQRTRLAIESSLNELGTHADLFLMHAPSNDGRSPSEVVDLRQQSWLVMEELHRAGSLRAIGVSNFEPRHIDGILDCGTVTPAVNQVELHAHLAQREMRAYCASHQILVEAFGSVGATGLRADPVVQEIAAAHKRTPAQVSLRLGLQRGAVVLAKSLTPKRIEENTKLFDFELSSDEVAALDALDAGRRTYWDNSGVP